MEFKKCNQSYTAKQSVSKLLNTPVKFKFIKFNLLFDVNHFNSQKILLYLGIKIISFFQQILILIYEKYFLFSHLSILFCLIKAPRNSIDLKDQNINLTVAIQVRFPSENYELTKYTILRIVDEQNEDQVLISLFVVDYFQMRLIFKLQNDSSQIMDLQREHWSLKWYKITILRDQCFNRLKHHEINMNIACHNQFNATLFIFQNMLFHLFVYDLEQFNNDEIIITNVLLIQNWFKINTLKDNLVIKFYAKYYCGQDLDLFFFLTLFTRDSFLFYQYNSNNIEMYLQDSNQKYEIQKIELSSDQWVLFSIEFDQLEIIIQYNINNINKVLVVQLEHYFEITDSQQHNHFFKTFFNVVNTNRIIIQYLQIYSLIKNNDNISCTKGCKFCLQNQCFDQDKPKLDFKISNEIKSSIYFNEQYFENYKYACNDRNYYQNNGNCVEFPKYQGKYCFNCEILQQQFVFINDIYYLGLRVNSFDYYLNGHYEIPSDYIKINNGLFFEKDLNIFIMKSKDIHLAYRLEKYIFCENGYTHREKCKKIIQHCLVQKSNKCLLSQQQYTLMNNKCIRCQKNCLYCKIIKKKITCILLVNDYYNIPNGLIKQCNQNSQILNCLPKDQAISELIQKGRSICQRYEIYDIETSQCGQMDDYHEYLFQFLEYYPIQIKYEESKLEIQDAIAEQSEQMNLQIIGLISFQQMSKLSELVQQQNKNQSLLNVYKNSEWLTSMNSTVEDISSKNITLHGIKIFLDEIPIIMYQNKKYMYLTNISDHLNIQFKTIQFDIELYQHLSLNNSEFNIQVDYEKYLGITFILNVSFNFNPSLLYKNANQIYFQSNIVIIRDLLFDQIEEIIDENLLDQQMFFIKSDQVFLENIMIQNVKLKKLFLLEDQFYVNIQNLWIKNSSINVFLASSNFLLSNQTIQYKDIYSIESILTQFLQIYGSQYLHIYNNTYVSTQFKGVYLVLRGEIVSVQIYNLKLINVTLIQSRLFHVIHQTRYPYTNFQVLNLYVHDSKIVSSSLFQIQNINLVLFQQINFNLVIFQQGIFFNLQNIVMTRIEQVCFYKLNIEGRFSLLYSQKFNQSIIHNFYVKKLYSQFQQLFYFQGNQTYIKNLNFDQFDIQADSLISIESKDIQIHKFIFQYFATRIAAEFTIDLFSIRKLSIKGMVFKSAVLNGTSLLLIQTIDQFCLRYLYIHNTDIITHNENQLIKLENIYKKNLIDYVYLKDISIKSQDKNYILFYFSNQKAECKLVIKHLQIKQIKNLTPLNAIYTIYTDVLQMELYNIRIVSTISINFLYSSSSQVDMEDFYIFNIAKFHIDQQSFIMHRSPQIIYEKEEITIYSFYVNYFEGIFITVETENKMFTSILDFTINNPFNNLQLFNFFLMSNTTASRLSIYRLQISNQINDTSKQLKDAFIETNFDLVVINMACIYNVSKQFLKTYNITSVTVIDFFANQYHSNETILDIQCEFLIINKFTIYKSQMYQGSVIDLIFQENNLKIDNVQFIDVTVNNAVIKLSSAMEQSTIKLSDFLLKDVISNQFLFQTTSSINQFTTSIIGGQQMQIYSSNIKNIKYINGLITDIKEDCILSENSRLYLNQSEIVNSNIIQKLDQMVRYKSQFLGTIMDYTSNIMIFLSLNNGKSFFNQIQTQKNLYQSQFSKNNKYLYLPSGRDIQEYHYFNFAKREYTKIYDSISFVNLFQAQKMQCTLQQNFNNQTIYEQELLLLPGVNKINNITFTLNPYNKDKYIELDLICNQNESEITYRTLIKTFNCQLGEHLLNDQCILCDIKSYLYSVGYNQQYCLYQDQNTIEQLKIGQIKLFKQFWRHSYANKYIELCKNQNCLGGWYPGDNSCLQVTQELYVRNVMFIMFVGQAVMGKQITNVHNATLIILSIQKDYLQFQFNCSQYMLAKIQTNNCLNKFTEILSRQNINQVNILFKLYYNYLFTLYLMKDSINFGQLIDFSLNMVYNPGFIAVPQFDCLINSLFQYPIQYTQLIIKILLPISLLNFIVIIYALLIKFQIQKYSIYIIIVCLLIIHQQNQQVILQSLIKLLSPIKYSNIYWTLENLNIEFYSKNHQHYLLVLIIPLIILITFINILIFIWIRYINKRINVHLKLSLFIYKQYKNQFYYWEYFRLAFIYLFMLILYSYENTYILLLTILIITVSHLYKPFELQNINQIDQIIYILSLYTYFGILIHQKDDSPNKFIIIIFSNLILIKLYLKYFLHSLNIQYRQQKVLYLNKMVTYMPKLVSYINVELYKKNEYYYSLLKQSRKKSKTAINVIIQSNEFQFSPPIEVEMALINKE
ncbi:hypothetical protein pb186bvf_015559 [Paramecium bursaria]